MISFKRIKSSLGLPTFEVRAGTNVLGIISNVPDHSMTWRGTAPDGTKFSAASKPKITQRLQIHAAQKRGQN